MKNKKGFTLLEILLVIGLIAALAVIVVVALNPAQRFNEARNSRRLSDIESILSAVQQYMVDNKGATPPGLSDYNGGEIQIGSASGSCNISTDVCSALMGNCLDLSSSLSRYLKNIPYDPQNGSVDMTHYTIQMNSDNIITIRACDSTDSTISSVSR
jgi:prepilin-type N-terminal cleavage/methylation domain-containing protein